MENFGFFVKKVSALESIAEDQGALLLGGFSPQGQEARLVVAYVNWPVSVRYRSWSILFFFCAQVLSERELLGML